jgi:S1-C subfamily serine protease
LRQHNLTGLVVNIITIIAAGTLIGYLLWQILLPNTSSVAKTITVRIDGANTGSGVIIDHQGDRYVVLSNWHVVSAMVTSTKLLMVQTFDGRKHLVPAKNILKVGKLDLAILEFQSRSHYLIASIGNSDRLSEGESLYIAGWADPSPQLLTRTYQFLVGNLSGRINHPRDGYALVYTVNALPGMSGGPVLDRWGNLVGINGRATVDLRTGTVNSVLGIDINRYLHTRGNLPNQRKRTYRQ